MTPTAPPEPLPVAAQWIDIPSADGPFAGYLALPPGGRGPGLVLFQEIFGVNPHIRAVAEQYALDGFVVLVPDLFWRDGAHIELGYVGEDRVRALALMRNLQPQQLLADVHATVVALRGRPELADRGKVGAIGYCLGGRLAYTAAALAGVDAAVAYYGGGIQTQLALAEKISCPMQFHYAEVDDNIPLSAVDEVKAAMAGKDAEVFVYPGAHHGFNCWARGAYHPASAALAHGRSLGFLASRLFD